MNKYFDHTILKPDATKEAVLQVVEEAKQYNLASVCVNQYRTKMVADLLKGTDVKVCTVIGFPLGAVDTKVKVFETTQAISDGAEEIDMVINIGAMKDGDYEYVREEIRAIKDACKDNVLKVIIETCLLTEEEIIKTCELAVEAGADFVKTSTGFSTGGAKAEDVALMKQTVGTQAKVKASGGIRDLERAKAMVEAGADRIGASKLLV